MLWHPENEQLLRKMGMTSFWNDVAEVRSVDDGTTYGQHA
jgi:hypothetical protein